MGLRFRKSIRLGKYARINLSKSGVGYSIGTKGIRYTRTATGRDRITASIPGTGISSVTESKRSEFTNEDYSVSIVDNRSKKIILIAIIIFVAVLIGTFIVNRYNVFSEPINFANNSPLEIEVGESQTIRVSINPLRLKIDPKAITLVAEPSDIVSIHMITTDGGDILYNIVGNSDGTAKIYAMAPNGIKSSEKILNIVSSNS